MSYKAHEKYKRIVYKSNNVRRTLESLVARNIIIIISRARGGINEREAASCTRLARKTRLSLQRWPTADGDQPIRTSPTKISKSKNTSSVPAVQMHACGRLDNCNEIYSRESHVMEEAPSASSSDIRRAISVPPCPKINPIRAARADTETFVGAEPDARKSAEFPWRRLDMLTSRTILVGSRWRKKW